MYDYKTCQQSEAAWLVKGKTEGGEVPALFGVHVCEDEYSPNGFGWYFASYLKGADGRWDEHDGGIYWDYSKATELEHVIGDTLPFREYSYRDTDYADFEAVVYDNDKAAEVRLFGNLATAAPEQAPKENLYSVRITERLERTVQVRAANRDEAKEKVADGWKYETHVLGADDFKGVDFKVLLQERRRGIER
ncbi:MAG: DpnD/PcfM family protein [Coriobacteriales bacterium]|jgi:hypothetical protein|nr:DpnD/PcfM family protein [Coriobacteriales bacterium]